MLKKITLLSFLILLLFTTGCAKGIGEAIGSNDNFLVSESTSSENTDLNQLTFLWNNKHPNSNDWTNYTLNAIDVFGLNLTNVRPADINSFCPKYDQLSFNNKTYFWIEFIASLTRYESNFDPNAEFKEEFTDDNDERLVSRGLLQLSIESARGYGCPINTADDLHDPETNLTCAVRIINQWVGRDGVISDQVDNDWKGGARYWSVLRTPSLLNQIQDITSSFSICR